MKNKFSTLYLSVAMMAMLFGCSNGVDVNTPSNELTSSMSSSSMSTNSFAEAGSSANDDLLDLIDQNVQKSSSSNGTSVDYSSNSLSSSSSSDPTDPIDPTEPPNLVSNIKILTSINTINLVSLNNSGAELLQTKNDGTMGVLHVNWDGTTRWILTGSVIYNAYLASQESQKAMLFQSNSNWSIVANEATTLGTPSTNYKEQLASNNQGIFWVDYGVVTVSSGSRGGGMGTSSSSTLLGKVLYQSWSGGVIDTLTDNVPYRARLQATDSYLTWVEYAPGATVGRIALLNLTSNQITYPSLSTKHQDRPSIDGDYLVWEEYLDANNAVIRSYKISTQSTTNLSSAVGFRTNPCVQGSRVVWEDQRSGDGDIWFYDLSNNQGEVVLISGAGHSAGVRIFGDKIVWTESSTTAMALLTAEFTP